MNYFPGTKISKYSAIRTEVDGITFASKREAARYQELKLLQRGGMISNLELQPVFPIIINGVRCGKYIADFAYFDGAARITEDVKGMKTPVYRLKKKIVEALYPGLVIREI